MARQVIIQNPVFNFPFQEPPDLIVEVSDQRDGGIGILSYLKRRGTDHE